MAVELRELRWAVVAAQHRSLRQAAEVLGVRQSTLSRCLSNLELKFGAVLFERSNAGTRLTLAGQEFLTAAQRIVKETDSIAPRVKSLSSGVSGRLAIGVHASLSAGNFRATLIEHRRRFPEVEVCLADGSSDDLISDLANCAIDLAFVAEEIPRWNDRSLPVWSERVVVALPDVHPLRDCDFVQWSALKDETVLLPHRGPGLEFLKLLAGKTGYPEPYRLIRRDVGLDRLLTMVGMGWGVLLALEGATGAVYPGVTYREMHDADAPTRLSFHAYWREDNSSPTLITFLDLLRERYPDLCGLFR